MKTLREKLNQFRAETSVAGDIEQLLDATWLAGAIAALRLVSDGASLEDLQLELEAYAQERGAEYGEPS